MSAPEPLPAKMMFRVEHIEYADIEVDTAGLIEEWGDGREEPWDREDVKDVLSEIGVQDLMYSGDFINVLERNTEDSIQ